MDELAPTGSGDTTPCKVTQVILHGVVSPCIPRLACQTFLHLKFGETTSGSRPSLLLPYLKRSPALKSPSEFGSLSSDRQLENSGQTTLNCTRNLRITQLKAQGPSRTCNESKEEEEEDLETWRGRSSRTSEKQ